MIGPTGVFVIDTKEWTGSVHQSADGLAWHNHYPLERTVETARWEAQIIGRLLGTRIAAMVCVHGAHVHGGGLHAQGVAIVPASQLRSGLGCDRVLSDAEVELLATTAWTRLHPAAVDAAGRTSKGQTWTRRSGCWLPVVSYSDGGTTSLPRSAGMGVPSMARPRQTAPTATPARAPRKPAGRSKASGRHKASKGREAASKATTAKPNPFDDIARQVNADQEAKDRQAGRDDLTPAAATSVDQAKAKPSATRRAATKPATPTRPAKPTRPTKIQASGNGVSFSGRPTTKVETVAARVKQAGLRIRADADVDAIAARLRATPAAVSAWLATRSGAPTRPQAKTTTKQPATAKAKPKQMNPEKAPTITLGHLWGDKKPDWLYRCTLVTRYEVRPDGTVWSTLDQVLGLDGKVVEDFWRLPLDFRPTQQVTGNGRKLVLKDRTIAGLRTWLIRAGLTTPEDITT